MKGIPVQDAIHIENCTRFCEEVEQLIDISNKQAAEREAKTGKKTSKLGYVEAVLVVAEKRRIEPDLAAAYLNPEIKEKLRFEYEDRHMLPRSAKLPF